MDAYKIGFKDAYEQAFYIVNRMYWDNGKPELLGQCVERLNRIEPEQPKKIYIYHYCASVDGLRQFFDGAIESDAPIRSGDDIGILREKIMDKHTVGAGFVLHSLSLVGEAVQPHDTEGE